MPKSCQYLHVRLAMEKEKLLGWALLTNISEGDAAAGPALRLNRHTVIDALRETQILLFDASQLDRRYKLKLKVSTDQSTTETEVIRVVGDKVCLDERLLSLRAILNNSLDSSKRVLDTSAKGARIRLEDSKIPKEASMGVF